MVTKILVAALVAIIGCYSVKKNTALPKEDSLRCINIYREFPVITETGEIIKYDPYETRIIYYKDQVMFQTYNYHAEINTKEQLVNPPYRYVYYSFTYSAGKKYGVLCDSSNIGKSRRVSVDSMLQKEWAAILDFIYLFNDSKSKLLSSEWLGNDVKQEKYSFIAKEDTGKKGTFSLRFSRGKFSDIPYSFSRELDSLYGMKLVGVDIVNNAREFLGYDSFHLQASAIPYRLEECRQLNRDEIMSLFTNEKKMIE